MAVVTTALTAAVSRTVFVKPPDALREWTPIPRALVNFSLQEGVIDAKPINDSQELIVTMTLDPQFAYRLIHFNASLIQDAANDWLNRAYLEVENAIRGMPDGQTQRHVVSLDDTVRNVSAVEMWMGRLQHRVGPTYVIQSTPSGAAIGCTFNAINQNAAAALAGTMDFLCTFLEFDIEQAERFYLHAPVMTLNAGS